MSLLVASHPLDFYWFADHWSTISYWKTTAGNYILHSMGLKLYNTLTRQIEPFSPLHPPKVTMYNCGPTVYNFQHIGNLRPYVFADILRRTLEQSGFEVEQIINITDVGHLVSDADEGEDKIELGARREGKSVEEIIAMYSEQFFRDLEQLNIKKASRYPRATHHIPEQIALIKALEDRGFTYRTQDGVYFDTSKFPHYAEFAQLDILGMKEGARVLANPEKRNPADFALWKFFSKPGEVREQEWESPWGKGFPGWHIECSAMAMKYLGETLDIHTGGIDHIPVHHTNEIAQSEAATGKPFVRYWLHGAFVNIEGEKISKSLGNTHLLSDLKKRGIAALAYRYWLLTAHYRTQVNFTWEAISGAQEALTRLKRGLHELGNESGIANEHHIERARTALADDLNTAQAIALLWELLKDTSLSPADKRATVAKIDEVLGLDLLNYKEEVVETTPELRALLEKREHARAAKDWATADDIRSDIRALGFEVKDTPEGQKLEKLA